MKRKLLNLLILALVGCPVGACAKDRPEKEPVTPDVKEVLKHALDRIELMLDRGFVVSRVKKAFTDGDGVHHPVGEAWHQGDALIWTGHYLAAAPCWRGDSSDLALLQMVDDEDGGLWRHPDIKTKPMSMDAAIGFYYGVAFRLRCPGALEHWSEVFPEHQAFSEPANRLSRYDDSTIPPEFHYVRDLLAWRLGARAEPHDDRLRILEAEAAGWVALARADRAACYRANVAHKALLTVEELGKPISEAGRSSFCLAAQGLDLPFIDHWCGDLEAIPRFVNGFGYDVWEYRPQRCPAWESPDGKEWLATPALDLIEAIALSYEID